MEYVQTVLVRLESDKLEEALKPQGLLQELDEHRGYLEQQPGFQDMRVVRSINPEGQVQLVVETLWGDDETLLAYETGEPTVVSIISKYQELVVPDSLQVMDMEALRSEAWRGPVHASREVQDRLALPFLVPLGIFLFGVLIVYGLSRIYLEIRPVEVAGLSLATPLALGIAAVILLLAWFIVSRPQISTAHIVGVAVVALAMLLGGSIFAAVHEEGGEAAEGQPPPASTPGPGGGADFTIAMVPSLKFDKSELTIPANEDVTVAADNRDTNIPHTFTVYTDDTASDLIAGTEQCPGPCTETLTLKLDPGEYFFRCEVHPDQMTGTLTAQ
ncbi:MAG: cupredoxin domain-containing protein [Chloroflexi bacterium]|nr:cupredoxin domain-containing protein [Chloroflexota bacterium]